MHDHHEGNYYTIGHVVQFTGLTDRTIRSHLAAGYLQGEKINDIWHFTPEQVEAYFLHPAVLPSLRARANGVVYDFLLDERKPLDQICTVLDLVGQDSKSTAEFFTYAINQGPYRELHFSLRAQEQHLRVILTGPPEQVLALVGDFYAQGN